MTIADHVAAMRRPLSRKPVRHACGHYEVRLMSYAVDPATGYRQAGSPCSSCAPRGRPVQPHYPTLADAQAACEADRG